MNFNKIVRIKEGPKRDVILIFRYKKLVFQTRVEEKC